MNSLSSIASIPSARDFSVIASKDVGAHGGYFVRLYCADVGVIERRYRTIEKPIKGKMYVAWRRKAKTPTYVVSRSRYHHQTLKAAVQEVIAQAIEARRATQQLSPDVSAADLPDTPCNGA